MRESKGKRSCAHKGQLGAGGRKRSSAKGDVVNREVVVSETGIVV
jgi:hypothetical protein